MQRPARVVLGRVVGAHGLGGALRVRVLGDHPLHLLRVPEVALARDGDEAPRWHSVAWAHEGRPGEVRMALEGVEDRTQAEALAGFEVQARESELEPLPPGEYYCYQLVGCEVRGHEGNRIGVVRAVWETGGHDVLVVEDEAGRELLLPAAEDLLQEVDVEQRRIVIEVIPGLLDAS